MDKLFQFIYKFAPRILELKFKGKNDLAVLNNPHLLSKNEQIEYKILCEQLKILIWAFQPDPKTIINIFNSFHKDFKPIVPHIKGNISS